MYKNLAHDTPLHLIEGEGGGEENCLEVSVKLRSREGESPVLSQKCPQLGLPPFTLGGLPSRR